MKTQIKRFSKSTLAVVLTLCMLAACITVGVIATNAAYINGAARDKAELTANAANVDAGADGAKADDSAAVGAKAPEAVGAKADSDSVGYDTGDGIHLGIGTTTLTWHGIGNGTYTFTLDSATTIYYKFVANSKEYKKDSSMGTPTESSSSNSVWYSKYNGNGGNFSIDLSAGTYNFKLGDTQSNGNELKYYFWKTSTSYTITYGTTTNGSLPGSPTSAASGTTVQFAVTPATGYEVDTVTYTPSGGSATACTLVSGTTYKFTMPSKNVTVNATFKKATYTITKSAANGTIAVTGNKTTAQYGDTVSFTVTPSTDYALKTLTVKQGSTTITTTNTGGNAYTFTMPAGNVTITATCVTTSGTAAIYFKSATAWVYHPIISVNGGAEQEMQLARYLENSVNGYQPKSVTGSLRYGWYKIEMTGIDTSKPVTIKIRGNDTYMEAEGTFTLDSGNSLYLACDNLMEGSALVDISNLASDLEALDFYDTPLNMIK